jgi:hypothetical protein
LLILTANVAALEGSSDPQVIADKIIAKVVPLGKRFFPSESAFPLREYCPHLWTVSSLLMPRTYRDAPCAVRFGQQGQPAIWLGSADFSAMWGTIH